MSAILSCVNVSDISLRIPFVKVCPHVTTIRGCRVAAMLWRSFLFWSLVCLLITIVVKCNRPRQSFHYPHMCMYMYSYMQIISTVYVSINCVCIKDYVCMSVIILLLPGLVCHVVSFVDCVSKHPDASIHDQLYCGYCKNSRRASKDDFPLVLDLPKTGGMSIV